MITALKVAKKWAKTPTDMQKQLLDNVYCGKCHVMTIVDYDMKSDKYGILFTGKCKKCGNDVARLIEDI